MAIGMQRINPAEVDDLIVGKSLLELPAGTWITLDKFDTVFNQCVTDLRNTTSRRHGQVDIFLRVIGKIQIGAIQSVLKQASLKLADSTASLDQQRKEDAHQHAEDNRRDSILSAELGTQIAYQLQKSPLSGSEFINLTGQAPAPTVARYVVSTAASMPERILQFGEHDITLGGVPEVPKVLTDGVATLGFKLGEPARSRRDGWRNFHCQAKGNCPDLGLAAGALFSLHFHVSDPTCRLLTIAQALAIDIEAKVSNTVKTATGKREYLLETVHNLTDIQVQAAVFFSQMTTDPKPIQAEFLMD